MTKSTVPASSVELHASSSAYYLWEFPEKPVAVRLSLDVVDRLERDVLESFRAITARGSEVGGLLLGHSESARSQQVVVENYELFRCDYTRGPLYLLSDEEKTRLDESVRRKKAIPGQAGAVVGFFRSNTRKELVLDDEDLDLYRRYFARPEQVFLLVKPFAARPCAAGFFIWENGKVRAEGSYIEFPLRRSELGKGEWAKSIVVDAPKPSPSPAESAAAAAAKTATRAPVLPFSKRDEEPPVPAPPLRREERPAVISMSAKTEEAAAPAPVIERKPEIPAPRKPVDKAAPPLAPLREEKKKEVEIPKRPAAVPVEKKAAAAAAAVETPAPPAVPVVKMEPRPRSAAGGKKLWALFGGLAMLALAGGSLYYLKVHSASSAAGARENATLQLKVERNGSQMVVKWNRDSVLIKSAQRAVLSISDGPQKEDVQLDLAQLHGGSIVYSPVTNDVSFRLEVTDGSSGKTRSEYVRVPLGATEQPATVQAPGSGSTTAAPPQQPQKQPQPSQPPTLSAEAARPTNEPQAARTEDAPPAAATPAPKPFSLAGRVRAPEQPAVLPEAPTVGAANSGGVVVSPSVPTRPLPAPPSARPSAPAPAQPQAQPPVPAPAAGQPVRVGGKVQPPSLLRKVEPTYPPMARQARVGGVVRMQATIGKDGKIKKVDVISGPPLLKQAAADAVMKWLYSPSLLNGAPIESTTDIDLNFSLNSR